jgi:hypothetical protein
LKHLVLFSVDTIEKDEFVLEKDENQGPANVSRLYFLSIEEIETLYFRRVRLKQKTCRT